MTAYRTTSLDHDARRDPKTETYCARCQKDLKPGQPRRWVHIVDGGGNVLHPKDEAIFAQPGDHHRGDLYCFPVGMDCARKIGLEFTFEREGA